MSADTQKPSKEVEGYFIFESDPQISAKWGKIINNSTVPQTNLKNTIKIVTLFSIFRK